MSSRRTLLIDNYSGAIWADSGSQAWKNIGKKTFVEFAKIVDEANNENPCTYELIPKHDQNELGYLVYEIPEGHLPVLYSGSDARILGTVHNWGTYKGFVRIKEHSKV